MRLWTGLLFIVTVALAWLLAAELFASVFLRTVATGVVVLQPVLAFEAGIVNSDVALTAVWTAFTLCAVRMVNRGPSPKRAVAVFALAALAVLTHGRGLPLVGAAVVALGLAWWRHRPPVRAGVLWAGGGAAVLAVGALVYKLVLNRSEGGALYGGELHLGHFHIGQFLNYLWQFYLPKLPGAPPRIGANYGYRQFFIEKYFGTFGSLEVGFAPDVMRLIQLLAFAGLVALAIALFRRRAEIALRWDVFALLAFIAGGCILFLHIVSYRAMVDGGGDPIIVGRYLLPLTPIFGLAVAFVVRSAGRRAGPYLAAFILALGVLLQLGGLGLTLDRFYG
jgi:4-amino-4-deoxy-L-arabinose transferase-like glycosyltransferase